jgi:hypothetical protein
VERPRGKKEIMMHQHRQAFHYPADRDQVDQVVPEFLTLVQLSASPPDVDAGDACRADVHHRKLVVKADYCYLEALFSLDSYMWRSSSSMFPF